MGYEKHWLSVLVGLQLSVDVAATAWCKIDSDSEPHLSSDLLHLLQLFTLHPAFTQASVPNDLCETG